MQIKKEKVFLYVIYTLFLLPVWLFLAWYCWPKTYKQIIIIDKTVLTKAVNEHQSLNWVLLHERYTKSDGVSYNPQEDYYGFYPLQNKKYTITGLEKKDTVAINKLAQSANMVYFTDTYGIYANEWIFNTNLTEHSKHIYGGMSYHDMLLLKKMKQQHKLILAEFNTIGSPTKRELREDFEKTFAIQWTGWTGRYFDCLDTTINKEIPHWLYKGYRNQHHNQWPFKKSGIAFVHNDGRIEVLEHGRDLLSETPVIVTPNWEDCKQYGIVAKQRYPYWFDIMYTERSNYVMSQYVIEPTEKGRKILADCNIPNRFPAVIMHEGTDYQFYYFCGDFCDNPIEIRSSYFKGIEVFSPLLYSVSDPGDRKSFFWRYYRPLLTHILHKHL